MAISESQARYRASDKYRAAQAAYRARNRDRLRANSATYRERNKAAVAASNRKQAEVLRVNAPEKLLFYAAKQRAKSGGLDFDITVADVVIPEFCPVFGTKFVRGDNKLAASLDRIDPARGYVKGNVQVISRLANTMKNDATLEQQVAFASWVLRGGTK